MEIIITVDVEKGSIAIKHPDDFHACIYFLELAKGMLIQKSLIPPKSNGIVPARIIPKLHGSN